MYDGRMVFSQLMDTVPRHEFRRCVGRYNGNYRVRTFTCWDQFLCMAFAQLTCRESLRDIEACLRSMPDKLYHMGIRSKVSRNTLAVANEKRDWRIYADFSQVLIHEARRLYADEPFGVDLDETVYALDSTTIDLCLSLFPWARFRKTKGAVKMHTLLDLRGNIPVFIKVTHAKVHDVNILDELIAEPYDRMEYADCFMLLVDAARGAGISSAALLYAVRDKLNINKGRSWGDAGDDGIARHAEQGEADGR